MTPHNSKLYFNSHQADAALFAEAVMVKVESERAIQSQLHRRCSQLANGPQVHSRNALVVPPNIGKIHH